MSTIEVTAHATPSVTASTRDKMDLLCVNTIRTLAMDAVQAANSGHHTGEALVGHLTTNLTKC